jgi:hypothetical protein
MQDAQDILWLELIRPPMLAARGPSDDGIYADSRQRHLRKVMNAYV